MQKCLNKFLIFIGAVTLLTIVTTKQSHAYDFVTSYDIIYEVLDSSETQAIQSVTIKNLNNKIFATSYTLTVSNIKIYDIEALDSKGSIKTRIDSQNNSTSVTVFFNDQVIGEQKELKWKLRYKTKDISIKNGQILDIYIPKVSLSANIDSYKITISVPDKFGPAISITPSPTLQEKVGDATNYGFDKASLEKDSISASFGNYQIFNFRLIYHLKNSNIFPVKETIALPPDIIERQQVFYKTLSKTPDNLYTDQDGNYIASYYLPGHSELTIDLTGTAKVFNEKIDPSKSGVFKEIPKDLIRKYTAAQKYWETRDKSITKISKDLKESDKTVAYNAHKVYDFVLQTLSYKNNKAEEEFVSRLGAVNALSHPNDAICMEFVDLFIALARSMGIPAREVNGFAYAKNSTLTPLSINLKGGDVLHSWASFYDPNFSWVPVDPTWGETSGLDFFNKLDTNHLAFVVKGANSEFPLPAGSYRLPEDKTPFVDVSFAFDDKELEKYSTKIEAFNGTGFNLVELMRGKKSLTIVNTGNTTVFNIHKIKQLPAYSSINIFDKVLDGKVSITFNDFEGSQTQLTLPVQDIKRTKISWKSYGPIIVIFLLALLLYMSLYTSITRKEYRKKQLSPHPRRPRDQGQ